MIGTNQTYQPEIANVVEAKAHNDGVVTCKPDFEEVLDRVYRATNHYGVLGLEFTATSEEIALAFDQARAVLDLSRYSISVTVPGALHARVERSRGRIIYAFSVLSDCSKKAAYDDLLIQTPAIEKGGEAPGPGGDIANDALADELPLPLRRGLHSFSEDQPGDERRKFERFNLALPVYVTGFDRISGEWHEITRTLDVSRLGATLSLTRRVQHRTLLHLALPLPMKLRCHRHSEPSYSVYALVRRVELPYQGQRIVAVEFVGEHPPKGHSEKPWAKYSTKWSGLERRREERLPHVEDVSIEYLSESMMRIRQEVATTENIAGGGMRVCVKAAPPEFDLIRVKWPARDFEDYATVCNRYFGNDRLERLCIQFNKKRLV